MITRTRALLVAIALVVAGTGAAQAAAPSVDCAHVVTQEEALNAVVAATNGDESAAGVLACAAAQSDGPSEADHEICLILIPLQGKWVVIVIIIEINSQGDASVNGEPVWDCPPYDHSA